jgi:hypothetical protein
MRKRVRELEEMNAGLQEKNKELSHEKCAWTRVEAGLKEKILKLQ